MRYMLILPILPDTGILADKLGQTVNMQGDTGIADALQVRHGADNARRSAYTHCMRSRKKESKLCKLLNKFVI